MEGRHSETGLAPFMGSWLLEIEGQSGHAQDWHQLVLSS